MPLNIVPRPIDVPGDRTLCATFDCGDDPPQAALNDFIRRKYWESGPRPPAERTLVAIVEETGDLYGFASYKVRSDLKLEGEEDFRTVIDIPIFAVDRRFHREVDGEGRRLSRRFFRTLEAVAYRDELASDEMEMHLVVEEENRQGRAFWDGIGFKLVETKTYPTVTYCRMLRAPKSPE
jgi:GNAT superfamily N-acetyltransferase